MRSLLASLLVSATVVLSATTAFAGKTTDITRPWSGRNGNWKTTGVTIQSKDGTKHSAWTSKNHVTGETRYGRSNRYGRGHSSIAFATENRAGKTTSVKDSFKAPGKARTKSGY